MRNLWNIGRSAERKHSTNNRTDATSADLSVSECKEIRKALLEKILYLGYGEGKIKRRGRDKTKKGISGLADYTQYNTRIIFFSITTFLSCTQFTGHPV